MPPISPVPEPTLVDRAANTMQGWNQDLENKKTLELSPQGLGQNAGLNALQLLLGIPQVAVGGAQMQQQYGSPIDLIKNNPVEYLKLMANPVVQYGKHMASYTPLQDVLEGNIGNYPERVTEQVYKNPVTTTLDALAFIQGIDTLKPNPQAKLAGDVLKNPIVKTMDDMPKSGSNYAVELTPEQLKNQRGSQYLKDQSGKFAGSKPQVAEGRLGEVVDKPIKIFRAEDSSTGVSSVANGRYFAGSRDLAQRYGSQITETTIPKGAKIFNFDAVKNKNIISQDIVNDPGKLADYVKKQGYDFIKNTNTKGVEYIQLGDTKIGGWKFDSGGAIPGEPLAWNKKYGVIEQLDEIGEPTGRFELRDTNGNIKGIFDSVQSAIDSIKKK